MKKGFIFLFGAIVLIISIMFFNSGSGELTGFAVGGAIGSTFKLNGEESTINVINDLDNKMFKVTLNGPVKNRFTFSLYFSDEYYDCNKLSKHLTLLYQSDVEENYDESNNKNEFVFYVQYSDYIYQKIKSGEHYSLIIAGIYFA